METGDVRFLPAIENALEDDFRYRGKGRIWIYPVKNAATTALKKLRPQEVDKAVKEDDM